MLVRLIVLVVIVTILFCLGSGLFFLVKDRNESTRVVKALTWRIGLSVLLFIFLMLSFWMGWIKPHGL